MLCLHCVFAVYYVLPAILLSCPVLVPPVKWAQSFEWWSLRVLRTWDTMHRQPHIWAFGPYCLEATAWPPSSAPAPPLKILNTGWTDSSRWLDCEKFWRNREVKHCSTSLYADSVQPVDGNKRFGLLAPSMNTNSKVGKHLPMDEISPGDIQRDNEDKHGGRRGESCDMIQMSGTDSLTQSRIRARRKKAESSSADRPQGAILRKVP